MLKKLMFIILLSLFINPGNATEAPGYFIDLNGDTLFVTFDIPLAIFSERPDLELIQFQVIYISDDGEKLPISPKKVKEVYFTINEREIRTIAFPNSLRLPSPSKLSGLKIFLEIITDGPVKLCRYYYRIPYHQIIDYMLIKNQNEMFQTKPIGFKKQMREYFKDCPDLVKRINEKKYRYRHLPEVVLYYNESCL